MRLNYACNGSCVPRTVVRPGHRKLSQALTAMSLMMSAKQRLQAWCCFGLSGMCDKHMLPSPDCQA